MRAILVLSFVAAVALARLPVARAHLDTWVMYETHSGNIAQALLDGLDLDLGRLPIFVHVRGSAFNGFLLAPLYAVFGCSALVRKVEPLLWHALTVGLLVYVMDRFFSRRAAVTAGLLFLCAPPMLAKLSVLGMGSHMESSLFMLLALIPFFAITLEKRTSLGLFFLFGLATGLAHTWHLQALVQCLILAGLLFVQMPRMLLGMPGLAIVAGTVLGAAPSILFTGLGTHESTWEVVKYYLASNDTPANAGIDSAAALYGQDTFVRKLGVLLDGGFVRMLEFYEAGPRLAPLLGSAWAALIVGASGLAMIQERRQLAEFFGRVFRFRKVEISPAMFFPLHIGLLLCLHLWSTQTAIVLTDMSSGAFNRRLAPVVTSLMILAALGMAGVRRPTPRWLWLGLLGVACLAGIIGQAGAARSTEASRLASRGECYEWFLGQLQHDAGGDASAMIETIRRIDRGDARFRSLRFQTPMGKFDFDERTFVEAEIRRRRRSSPEYNLYRATALGRALAEEPDLLLEGSRWAHVDAVADPLRGAMLHGIGLGLFVGGPSLTESWNSSLGMLRRLCEAPEAARGEAIAEGCGFLRGFNLDVYTHQVDCIDDFECLPDGARAAFYRGFGWGFRQRYASPPDHVPNGLVVVKFIPPGNVADFTDGYLLRRLPCEAATMGSAQGR